MTVGNTGAGQLVRWPVEISGAWGALAAIASSLGAESASCASYMQSASLSWKGLISSYQETETAEIVYGALDEVPEVTREWADVAGALSEILQTFATEAKALQQQSSALRDDASRLQARAIASGFLAGLSDIEVSGEHDSLLHSIDVHNREVIALDSRWHQVEQQTAAEIDSLSGRGGLHDEIPTIRAGGLVAGVHDVSMSGSVNPPTCQTEVRHPG